MTDQGQPPAGYAPAPGTHPPPPPPPGTGQEPAARPHLDDASDYWKHHRQPRADPCPPDVTYTHTPLTQKPASMFGSIFTSAPLSKQQRASTRCSPSEALLGDLVGNGAQPTMFAGEQNQDESYDNPEYQQRLRNVYAEEAGRPEWQQPPPQQQQQQQRSKSAASRGHPMSAQQQQQQQQQVGAHRGQYTPAPDADAMRRMEQSVKRFGRAEKFPRKTTAFTVALQFSIAAAKVNPHVATQTVSADVLRKSVRVRKTKTSDIQKMRVGDARRAVYSKVDLLFAGNDFPCPMMFQMSGVKGPQFTAGGQRGCIVIPARTDLNMYASPYMVHKPHKLVDGAVMNSLGDMTTERLMKGVVDMQTPGGDCLVMNDSPIMKIIGMNRAHIGMDPKQLPNIRLRDSPVRYYSVKKAWLRTIIKRIDRDVFQKMPYIGGVGITCAVHRADTSRWGDYSGLARAQPNGRVLNDWITTPHRVTVTVRCTVILCGRLGEMARAGKHVSFEAEIPRGIFTGHKLRHDWGDADTQKSLAAHAHGPDVEQDLARAVAQNTARQTQVTERETPKGRGRRSKQEESDW